MKNDKVNRGLLNKRTLDKPCEHGALGVLHFICFPNMVCEIPFCIKKY